MAQLVVGIKRGWKLHSLATEVRSHGRCRTDISFRPTGHADVLVPELIIGVEAKLHDWQGAIRQAALNRYAVNGSFIAMPTNRLHANISKSAELHGVGVMTLTGRDIVIATPAPLGMPDELLKGRMDRQLQRTRTRGVRAVEELFCRSER